MGTWRQQGRSADRVEGVPSVARIVVMGGGVVALGSAMLLAGDGHEVIVLERDPAPPPDDPADAWERWERPGLNQFRLPHAFLGGFRAVLEAELPEVAKDLESAGALRLNFIRDVMPEAMTGGWRDGDERYEWLTGRRVLVEAVLAAAAEATPGVEIRHRLGEIEAGLRGVTYDSPDPAYQLHRSFSFCTVVSAPKEARWHGWMSMGSGSSMRSPGKVGRWCCCTASPTPADFGASRYRRWPPLGSR
jgi:hypothetical protein